jgi:hypothetical protein
MASCHLNKGSLLRVSCWFPVYMLRSGFRGVSETDKDLPLPSMIGPPSLHASQMTLDTRRVAIGGLL